MISAEKHQNFSKHHSYQTWAISSETVFTLAAEQDRHLRYGKSLTLSMLASGYSIAAILEGFKYREIRKSKLSKAEGRKIFERAAAAAVAEWSDRTE